MNCLSWSLICAATGDMSLVGPRPHAIAMKAGDRPYGDAVEQYFHRHRVRPGITGWAQVNGLRGEIDTLQKAHARVAHDIYYIDNWSLWLDLKIFSGENSRNRGVARRSVLKRRRSVLRLRSTSGSARGNDYNRSLVKALASLAYFQQQAGSG